MRSDQIEKVQTREQQHPNLWPALAGFAHIAPFMGVRLRRFRLAE